MRWQAEAAPGPQLLAAQRTAGRRTRPRPRLAAQPRRARAAGRERRFPTARHRWRRPTPGTSSAGSCPRLGDGRALLLGELVDADGRLRDLHLKGSGPHAVRPRRRRAGRGRPDAARVRHQRGDARAGHPDDAVAGRGRDRPRRCTARPRCPARCSPGSPSSHLRVGSFQYAASPTGDVDLLRRLADHAIARHYPDAADAEQPYLALLEAVVAAQARLVAQWMLVGFIHGVMNTDNMTISGETIDYGPCAFMEALRPGDGVQLDRQLGSLRLRQPAVDRAVEPGPLRRDPASAARRGPGASHRARRGRRSAGSRPATTRPGRPGCGPSSVCRAALADDGRRPLADELLAQLQQSQVDYTSFFRAARRGRPRGRRTGARGVHRPRRVRRLADAMARAAARTPRRWTGSTRSTSRATISSRKRWPRRTAGDLAPLERLLEAVGSPYDERPGLERYAEPGQKEFSSSFQTFCGT